MTVDKMLRTDVYKPTSQKFNQVVQLFPFLLEHGRSVPPTPAYNQLTDILTNEVVLPALQGSKSPAAALKDGQAKAQQAIDSAKS